MLGVIACHQVVAIVTDFACDFPCIFGDDGLRAQGDGVYLCNLWSVRRVEGALVTVYLYLRYLTVGHHIGFPEGLTVVGNFYHRDKIFRVAFGQRTVHMEGAACIGLYLDIGNIVGWVVLQLHTHFGKGMGEAERYWCVEIGSRLRCQQVCKFLSLLVKFNRFAARRGVPCQNRLAVSLACPISGRIAFGYNQASSLIGVCAGRTVAYLYLYLIAVIPMAAAPVIVFAHPCLRRTGTPRLLVHIGGDAHAAYLQGVFAFGQDACLFRQFVLRAGGEQECRCHYREYS